jgi:hypothetical protein
VTIRSIEQLNAMTIAVLVKDLSVYDNAFKFSKKKHPKPILVEMLHKAEAEAQKASRKGTTSKVTDHVMFEPRDAAEVVVPKPSSKRALVMSAMVEGVTIDKIVELTGWQKQAANGFFNEDVKRAGYGVRKIGPRSGATYKLIVPKGAEAPTYANA